MLLKETTEDNSALLPLELTAISIMGLFISIAWYYVAKGGKAWQKNWEKHIDFLEEPHEGNLHKVVLGNKAEFYSVSRINKDVIWAWGIFWLFALMYSVLSTLFDCLFPFCAWLEDHNAKCLCIILIIVILLSVIFAFLLYCRTKRWKTRTDGDKGCSCKGILMRPKRF